MFYHAIRHANGSWTTLNPVGLPTGTPPVDVDCAGINGELHYAVTTSNDNIVAHRIRHADGTWTNFFQVPGAPLGFRLSVSNVGGELQIAVLSGVDFNIYHSIRHANGAWEGFGSIGGSFFDVASASVAGELQLVGLDFNNTIFHRIRHADGSWTGFGNVNGAVTGSGGTIQALTVSGGTSTW